VDFAEGVWTFYTFDGRIFATVIAEVPGTEPSSIGFLGKFKARHMVAFSASILIAHDELTSISTYEAIILMDYQ